MLGYPCDHSISLEIQRFLRPKELCEDTPITHNWGDWYCFLDYTQIRVYGFEGKPYLLPIIVPNRVARLELIKQLSIASAKHLTDHGKQSIVPGLLVFLDFIVKISKSYGLLQNKLGYYKMVEGDPRSNFDPEGYMGEVKASQKLRAGEHFPLMPDDFIRNMERQEAIEKRTKYDKVSKAYKWKLSRGKINEDIMQGMDDPLAKANKLMQHELEILNGVPTYVFRDRRQGVRDTESLAHMSPQSISEYVPVDSPGEGFPPGYDYDMQMSLATGQYGVQEINDIRLLEHEEFISDNDFIHIEEFNKFMC